MTRILIDWSDPHRRRGDHNLIPSQLAAGGDEEPLIVVTASVRPGLGSRPIPVEFKDLDQYLGHLAMYDGDVRDGRFFGFAEFTDWAVIQKDSAALFEKLTGEHFQ